MSAKLQQIEASITDLKTTLGPYENRRWWLHYIGKSYYGTSSFAREAKKYGVTRRAAPNVLRQMKFGDLVLCAQWDGRKGVVFGFFEIVTLTGLSPEALAAVREKADLKQVSAGGYIVRRKCGQYIAGPTYAVSEQTDIPDVIAAAGDTPLGKPMVGGEWQDLPAFYIAVPHRQGFRRIDLRKLLAALEVRGGERNAHLIAKGQFYVFGQEQDETPTDVKRLVGEVRDYHRAEELQLPKETVPEPEQLSLPGVG